MHTGEDEELASPVTNEQASMAHAARFLQHFYAYQQHRVLQRQRVAILSAGRLRFLSRSQVLTHLLT